MATAFQRFRKALDPGVCLLAILYLLPLQAASAVQIGLSLQSIESDDWFVDGLQAEIASSSDGQLTLKIRVAKAQLPDQRGSLNGLQLHCDADYFADGWRCAQGTLIVSDSPVGPQEGTWSGVWAGEERFSLSIPSLQTLGGTLDVLLDRQGKETNLDVRANRLSVPATQAFFDLPGFPRPWKPRGRLSGSIDIQHVDLNTTRIAGELVVDQFNYASPDGTQAVEDVVVRVEISAQQRLGEWSWDSSLLWPRGALYSDPLYLDAAEGTIVIDLAGSWDGAGENLEISSGSMTLGDAITLSGAGRFDLETASIKDMTLAAHSDDADQVYALFLQPYLFGTPADDMSVSGNVGFVLHFDNEGLEQAGLSLNRLALLDREGRFALQPTTGNVAWNRVSTGMVSNLFIDGVTLLGIGSESFEIKAEFAADRVTLVDPVVVPLLDGEVALERFELSGALIDRARPEWAASASVRDVSLERLTAQLGWPSFNGRLAAVLTDMRYVDSLFSIGGELRLTAFDGDINVSELAIREPLGAVPLLTADATMRGLNLEALTETFSFGRIEGRLDGDLEGLQLVAWRPDTMKLHLFTPPNDNTRRRISQRAVENLTELGSGVPGGLSTSFLSIFDEFSYAAIDARIQLEGDTAVIGGLARDDGGYYLVRGSGLPRIDVIGHNRRVAWEDLVERLQKIQVEGAKIE